ncbi:MAG TPA: riboflavin synthase [Thermoanaerobaculia bacterium]|nr:riboflavin synthase [Thermoanaerobaculia bacterium]
MFTGLITERGRLTDDPRPSGQGGVALAIAHSAELARRLSVGASLAVSGVCLTVTSVDLPSSGESGERGTGVRTAEARHAPAISRMEVSPETLSRTTLGALRKGDRVNLEAAMRAGDPLGGHLVQGHVDGTAEVVGRRDLAEHRELAFSLPGELAPYLVMKGSVTVDGVSLTVAALRTGVFEVALIPHTLEVTTVGELVPGARVNLEADVLAKYVERLLAARGLIAGLREAAGAGELP